MSPDKLVYMANQIGKFFAHQPADKAVESVADHLLKFWDPRMRKAIVTYFEETGGAGLEPVTLNAVRKIWDRGRQRQETPAALPQA